MTTLTVAATLEEAANAGGEIRAGGTDCQERRRSGISKEDIVDISQLSELCNVMWGEDASLNIGALVKISTIGADRSIAHHFPGLTDVANAIATPQIRTIGTVGGAILQRTRCRYYRNPTFHCYKRGGVDCPSRLGNGQFGVCFDLGPCVNPHPSSIGMALSAYEAEVEVYGRGRIKMTELYGDGSDPARDHQLKSGEILTHIHLPPPVFKERVAHRRIMGRSYVGWPVVECLIRLVIESGTVKFARIALGGVANIPLRLHRVEVALVDKTANEKTLTAAAELVSKGANPIPHAAYKIQMISSLVLDTLQLLTSGDE